MGYSDKSYGISSALKYYLCVLLLLMCISSSLFALKTCGATRKPEFPRTGLDRTETSLGSEHVSENIFGSGRVRGKDFGPVQVGVFFTRVSYIFSKNFKNKVELNGYHASHSQPE